MSVEGYFCSNIHFDIYLDNGPLSNFLYLLTFEFLQESFFQEQTKVTKIAIDFDRKIA